MNGKQINKSGEYGGPFVNKDDRCGHFYGHVLIHIRSDMYGGERRKADWWIERGDMEDVQYFMDRLRKRYSTWEIWYNKENTTIEMREK